MVDITIDKLHAMMSNQTNIRNISVIAHVDHGKSTLTDILVIKAKIASSDSGGGRYMDTRADEKERGITIKSTAISMLCELDDETLKTDLKQKHNGKEFLINLIDSPGHVDFSSEVTAALRVTDGALVVIDCVDGICVQTETVLRQSIAECIKPTVVLNKLDRALLELNEPKVELAQKLRARVRDFNERLSMITLGRDLGDFKVEDLRPDRNEFSFCSGLQGWGFTLKTFAKFYVKRLGLQNDPNAIRKICEALWAENRFFTKDDPWDMTGTFRKVGEPDKNLFVVFVLNPIYKVKEMCYKNDVEGIKEYLGGKYGVDFTGVNLTGKEKELFKTVFKTWLPAADMLLEQIVVQLPSPVTSQVYRSAMLYEGPCDDECALAIKKCDKSEEAPLMMYVSKMVPYTDSRFIAFGRVYSGVVSPGMKVRIQGPDYVPGTKNDLYIRSVQRTVVMMGRTIKDVPNCPAGNIIGLIGIDNELKKTGTITTRNEAHNIKSMKFSVSPVVKYSVRPKNAVDLPKLKEGLLKLSKSDPMTVVNFSDNGELTIAGAGELHLEICLNDLRNDYACVDIIVDEPLVTYLEGISGSVDTPKMSKSANKHNRIYMTCSPLEDDIVEKILDGKCVSKDPKERAAMFKEHCGISDDWVKKVLFYGPEDKGPNICVDNTKGIAYLNEVKEFLREGFRDVTTRGPLIGEQLRGVRFELNDLVLHSDAIHRTGNQVTAPMSSVCKGLVMAANPILYEPIFQVEVNVSRDYISGVSSVLCTRRGECTEFREESAMRTNVYGTLPVREAFGFNNELMKQTKGQASSVLSFSHYAQLPGSIDNPGSILYETVMQVRKRRGLGEIRGADCYFDRL
ncbi:Elongation factor 2 [Astathelohania contejeani]|uniref:Elongation factor 2 n=1 Tax=Astathelohania contejeani TaxID=164912 RepID=A0ABQ7HZA6_9MICR|nr:Elongation factor 2 [Thelohania contejeani]